jgi:hypothetical protein
MPERITLPVVDVPDMNLEPVLRADPAAGPTAPVLVAPEGTPIVAELVCGACATVLAEVVEDGEVEDVVIQCPNCGAYNKT